MKAGRVKKNSVTRPAFFKIRQEYRAENWERIEPLAAYRTVTKSYIMLSDAVNEIKTAKKDLPLILNFPTAYV